ncbi:organic cation transporter protein-like [Amyelois transitella]|uniref:organic cation transporter protein-like n=1 Tax=Amyelois transitella TaxID=680683 RepID=UPI00298FD921|nr:organic cation transporter protein-like [Amyelois transitella]
MAVETCETVKLDDILKKFGFLGRYQVQMTLLLSFVFFINGMHSINYIFVAEEVPYRCKVDQCESNPPIFEPLPNFVAPNDSQNCYKYKTIANDSGCTPKSFNSSFLERCDDWVYPSKDSFVVEFGLECQEWKRTFIGTVHSIGLMMGLFFQGQLSDKIGRKLVLIIVGVLGAVLGTAKSFAGSYFTYIILEFLEATFGDNSSPGFIISIEFAHSDNRLRQQIFICIAYAIGAVVMSTIGYYVTYWRHFVQAIYIPALLFLLYIFLMHESVRWLLSKGRKQEATKILLKIAKTNGVTLEKETLENLQCEELRTESSPLRDTFRSQIVVKRFLVCLIWWISCNFIFVGLVVNVVSLAGNKYLNFAIMSLTEIPSSFAMVYTLNKFKRKKPLFWSFMAAGVLCLVQPFVPKSHIWLSTGLYFIGRFIATYTFTVIYMYTSELFPTYTRNSMHALCSSIGRIGSVVAPMTPLLAQYTESLPTLVIGAISLLAGLTTLLVPDVANEPLPDNVKQAESIGNHRTTANCC